MRAVAAELGGSPLSFQVTSRCGPADEALGGYRLLGTSPLPSDVSLAGVGERLEEDGFERSGSGPAVFEAPTGWRLSLAPDGAALVLSVSGEVDGPLPTGLPEPLPCG